jgi:hypothetical protein
MSLEFFYGRYATVAHKQLVIGGHVVGRGSGTEFGGYSVGILKAGFPTHNEGNTPCWGQCISM